MLGSRLLGWRAGARLLSSGGQVLLCCSFCLFISVAFVYYDLIVWFGCLPTGAARCPRRGEAERGEARRRCCGGRVCLLPPSTPWPARSASPRLGWKLSRNISLIQKSPATFLLNAHITPVHRDLCRMPDTILHEKNHPGLRPPPSAEVRFIMRAYARAGGMRAGGSGGVPCGVCVWGGGCLGRVAAQCRHRAGTGAPRPTAAIFQIMRSKSFVCSVRRQWHAAGQTQAFFLF